MALQPFACRCCCITPPVCLPCAYATGRLLLQRLRKSQSTTVLYGEPENALEQLQLQDGGGSLFPQMDGGGSQVGAAEPLLAAWCLLPQPAGQRWDPCDVMWILQRQRPATGWDSTHSNTPCLPYAPSSLQRLIVVANRLPVSAYKDRAGRWQLQVGPLALALGLPAVGCWRLTLASVQRWGWGGASGAPSGAGWRMYNVGSAVAHCASCQALQLLYALSCSAAGVGGRPSECADGRGQLPDQVDWLAGCVGRLLGSFVVAGGHAAGPGAVPAVAAQPGAATSPWLSSFCLPPTVAGV